ncbi:MAG: hypothetical protein NT106_09605 [Candidatus Sumerlaeota bacterium]|nr:hypothetical protein [Candidatus Sumerlaeota bacterium]
MNAESSNLGNSKPLHADKSSDFLLAEYAALRSEILKRSETQNQLISLALIASGTFLTLSLQNTSTIALVYPILALFLAMLWVQHDYKIRQIGAYIKERIEKPFLSEGLGWEHRPPSSQYIGKVSVTSLASSGIIIGTQILAVAVGILKTSFYVQDVVLLAIDTVVILLSLIVVRHHKYDFNF